MRRALPMPVRLSLSNLPRHLQVHLAFLVLQILLAVLGCVSCASR